MIESVKTWIAQIIEVAVALAALGIVLQILFGEALMFFAPVTDNLMAFIANLGDNGLIGLIALVVIIWLFSKANLVANANNSQPQPNRHDQQL